MTSYRYTADDIAAMREQGDLTLFLQGVTGREPPRASRPAVQPPPPRPAGRRPGAWPTGSRPPEPGPSIHPDEIARAVAEYQTWYAAGRPLVRAVCECGCTPGNHPRPPAA